MSYYDTCRAQKKGLYIQGKDARIRAERKKLYFQSIRGDPLQSIRLTGLPVSLTRDQLQYEQSEAETNLVPWQAKPDVKIDRFDVRSMLDFYVEPEPGPKFVEADEDLEVLLNYERYRMIIRSVNHGVGEAALLRKVDEQLAIKTAHMDQQFDEDNQPKPFEHKRKKKKAPNPDNIYDAVGFAYKDNQPFTEAEEKGGASDSDGEDLDMEIYEELEFGGKKTLSEHETEKFAHSYGIAGFSMIQNADEENEMKSKEREELRKAQAEALDEALEKRSSKSQGNRNRDNSNANNNNNNNNSNSSGKPSRKRSYMTEPALTFNAAKHAGKQQSIAESSSDSEEDLEVGKRFFVTSFTAGDSKLHTDEHDTNDVNARRIKEPSHRSMALFFPDLQQLLPREEAMMPLSGRDAPMPASFRPSLSSQAAFSASPSPSLKGPPGVKSRELPLKTYSLPPKKLTAAEKMRQRIKGAITQQLSDDHKAAEDKLRERANERRIAR